MENKVFLGGTCTGYNWRKDIIKYLKMPYFNPVVKNWNKEKQAEEYRQKEEVCKYELYIITPYMKGTFSIAEVIDSVHLKGSNVIFCVMEMCISERWINGEKQEIIKEFDRKERHSLEAVKDLVRKRGGRVAKNMAECYSILNFLYAEDLELIATKE